jgi:hypothetical protein
LFFTLEHPLKTKVRAAFTVNLEAIENASSNDEEQSQKVSISKSGKISANSSSGGWHFSVLALLQEARWL